MSDSTESTSPNPGKKQGCESKSLRLVLRERKSQADTRPRTSDPVQTLFETKGYTMVLKKGTKRITLLRFLLAKLAYGKEGEGLSLDEYLVLNEVFFSLLDNPDPLMQEKWKDSFENLKPVFQAISEFKEFPVLLSEDSQIELGKHLWNDPILPKPSAYFGLLGNRELRNSFRVSFRSEWIPKKRVERYIGVGYKDKGTCRVPSLDGSPSWQRVATVVSNQEREAEELAGATSPIPPDGVEGSG
jgi:hypothetical protein